MHMTKSKTTKTITAYNKNAEKYNAKFKDFPTYTKKIREFQARFIPEGARVLDLGCGPGNNISIIKSRDASCTFTGVDLSEDLLAIARSIHPSSTFVNQDICSLTDIGKFDSVIASFCIVHLDNEETEHILQFISSSLEKGGSLYLSFMEGSASGFESTSFSREEIYFNYYPLDYNLWDSREKPSHNAGDKQGRLSGTRWGNNIRYISFCRKRLSPINGTGYLAGQSHPAIICILVEADPSWQTYNTSPKKRTPFFQHIFSIALSDIPWRSISLTSNGKEPVPEKPSGRL